MTPLARVKDYLKHYPDLEIILLDTSTHTAQLAADALGVQVGQIAKSLVFQADNDAVLVVTSGDRKVDAKKLAGVLGVKKVRFANADTVLELTGFSVGGVAPVGLLTALPVYLDISLYRFPIVYAAAGTANSALPVTPARLQEITSGTVIDVCSR